MVDFFGQQKTRKALIPAGFWSFSFTSERKLVELRELNPRPKLLRRRYYMLSLVFTFADQLRTDTPLTDYPD